MKKNYLAILLLVVFAIVLTGCSCEKKTDELVTITCTAPKSEDNTSMDITSVVTYTFNKDQMATKYKSVSTQKFNDEETYNTYKEAQEESTKDTSNKNVTYTLEADDNAKTLVFTMTVENLDTSAETEEDKVNLKASTILSGNEALGYKCELKGVEKSELK